MAQVFQRVWRSGPRNVRRAAWGYTFQRNGKQVRKFSAAWSKEDAERELAAALVGEPSLPAPTAEPAALTFSEGVARYLRLKARKKSLPTDAAYLKQMTVVFGADTPLADVTSARISAWKADRIVAMNPRTGEPYAAATINRPLAALRHLLRVAHDEWEVLATVPRIRLEDEPEGRIRWLEPDAEARLLAACQRSRNPEVVKMVTIALESGMRRGEILGLTRDRVDLSRGVVRLEVTKSGRRREIPMRQAVYNLIAAMPEPRDGRVFKTRSIRTAFDRAAAAAKLDDFTFHDCRHHFASWFVMRGGSLQALQKLLGHATLEMTQRDAHLSPDYLRNEVAKTERPSLCQSASTTSAHSDSEGDAVRTSEELLSGNSAP